MTSTSKTEIQMEIPFQNKNKKPVKEGDRITVSMIFEDQDARYPGTVQSVLDTQFTFTLDAYEGTFFCNYDGDWKHES